MADIYLAYASENRAIVCELFTLLSTCWDVWWDRMILQRFTNEIESQIAQARCMIVCWSAVARAKDTVTDEVVLAKDANVPIVAVTLDGSASAYGFGGYSCSDLSGWTGEDDHPGLRQLLQRVTAIVQPRASPRRPEAIGSGRLALPTLFLSISSYETQLKPSDAVKVLDVSRFPTILVSAWDMVARRRPHKLIEALHKYSANGGFILVDSGNYEASRLSDKRWRPSNLAKALASAPHDWVFCFDEMQPSRDPNAAAQQIIDAVTRDQVATSKPVLPIVHAPKLRRGGYRLDILDDIILTVASILQPKLIAVPERELGTGLFARAKTMMKIRAKLNTLPFYQPVHLLGTGNPWSIAILTAAGADSFDGLEWCRVVVDMERDSLHHFQHFNFFTYQTGVAESMVAREALQDSKIDFAGKAAFHNIDYYTCFVRDLRIALTKGRLEAFIGERIGKAPAQQLSRDVGGLFK